MGGSLSPKIGTCPKMGDLVRARCLTRLFKDRPNLKDRQGSPSISSIFWGESRKVLISVSSEWWANRYNLREALSAFSCLRFRLLSTHRFPHGSTADLKFKILGENEPDLQDPAGSLLHSQILYPYQGSLFP
jgi:hypothetical protein